MFRITIIDTFSSAHQLKGYKGKCEALHGHNWKVEVEVDGKELDDVGMLFDFHDLKRVVRDVLGGLDHRMLNELEPFAELNPTSEIIARYIYTEVRKGIPDDIRISSVTVWESDAAKANYSERY